MRTINLTFRWPAFEWQVEATRAFYLSGIRNHVWVIARQNGKTTELESVLIEQAARGKVCGYFAPAYDRSEEVYLECVEALADVIDLGYATNKQTKAGWVIRFRQEFSRAFARARGDARWERRRGGAVHFKSLGNPEHLRGGTFDLIVEDEAGLVRGRVHRKILLPMIRVRRGTQVLVGTPPEPDECADPRFFKGVWRRAAKDRRWYRIHRDYTCHPSPFVREEIEEDRKSMPEDEFAREYLATFPTEGRYRLPAFQRWGPSCETKLLPDGLRIATGVDLADNEREIGDKAAVVTWGIGSGGRVYILAAEYYKNPSEVLDACYVHWQTYASERIVIQKTTFDKGFRHTCEAAGPTRGYLPVVMTSVGGASKRRRIMQLEPIARQGRFFVHEDLREFMLEWADFPDGLADSHAERRRNRRANHYDMLDGCAPLVEDVLTYSTWLPREEELTPFARAREEIGRKQRRGRKFSRHPSRFYRVR